MSLKTIDKKIATFITNRDKLKTLGHEIAMLIFDHALEHGDCTRAIKLAGALPNSWGPQMEAWFKAFTPIRVVLTNNKCEFDPKYKSAASANKPDFWDREAAEATPFYNLGEEAKAAKPLDFAALVKLVQDLGKRIEKKVDAGEVMPEDIESAKAISATVKSLSFKRVIVKPANDPAAAPSATKPRKARAPAAPALSSIAA